MEILRRETDYALRALIALSNGEDLISTRRLAEKCGVTLDHIRKIMPKLARAGIVRAIRGASGGFTLARAPSDIRLNEIIAATQGPLVVNMCIMGAERCPRHPDCPIAVEVDALQQEMDRLTSGTTLADLAKHEHENS